MDKNLNSKIVTATKWSAVTEILAKLIVPVSNMILARILAPEVFGIIATVNMIISFCDMFTQAGFQKYLIQHPYKTKEDLHRGASVAFWTNFSLSVFLWFCLVLFRFPIAAFVGNGGYESAIAVAGMSLPITALSSIQIAMQQRKLDYKTLFYNRLFAILTPLVVTIPLALLGFSYWSLIIGTIVGYSVQATVLTIRSEWKPNLFYRFSLLREMLSFSVWTLFESLALWLSTWVDIFIISNALGSHFTGLYKTSQTTVTGILTIVTNSVTSVLFSSLSKVQDDNNQFEAIFLNFQKAVGMLVLPLGAGMLLYNTLVTKVLLGNTWLEAAPFIGIWGLCTTLVATYGTFSREAYRAKGKPKVSLVAQLLHLIFVVPVCLWGVKRGFGTLIYVRSFAYLQIILMHMIFMKFAIKFKISKMFTATFPCIISTLVMVAASLLLKQLSSAFWFEWLSIFICIIVYFSSLLLFPSYRSVVFENIKKVKAKILK
ncbi:MAG: lipopolysaccharide biosynthesis protein [Oscillospiraceae bacterium]|nr:lipopolysaccharide biosynthesis protein [Oscillospiraceae bacterium]